MLPEAPSAVSDAQLGNIPGVERDVRMPPHRRHQRTLRNRHIIEDATIFQSHGNYVQVVRGLGLIEKKLS